MIKLDFLKIEKKHKIYCSLLSNSNIYFNKQSFDFLGCNQDDRIKISIVGSTIYLVNVGKDETDNTVSFSFRNEKRYFILNSHKLIYSIFSPKKAVKYSIYLDIYENYNMYVLKLIK
jgi:hypothetical protein